MFVRRLGERMKTESGRMNEEGKRQEKVQRQKVAEREKGLALAGQGIPSDNAPVILPVVKVLGPNDLGVLLPGGNQDQRVPKV